MLYKGALKQPPSRKYDSLVAPISEIANSGFTITLNFYFGSYSFMDWRYPDAWAQEYKTWYHQMGDPVVRWALGNTGTIRWSDIDLIDPLDIFGRARRHGINHGAACCLSAGNRRSLLTVGRNDRELADEELNSISNQFSQIVNEVARGFFLSERERAVLRLLATGLRQSDIASELGISISAVRQRTAKAVKALDCRTPEQAIAVATTWGYLTHEVS